MEENEVSLPIQKITYHENGVNFITAHGSKGLEFEYVFMLGCNSKIWDKPGRNYTYKLPDNLVFKTQTDETQETRRLFYVGMTRAKQHLCISYATHDASEKELEKSRFVAEIEENTNLKNTPVHLPDSDLLEFKLNVLKSVEEMPSPLIDANYIDQILQNYALSVTHLNSYLKCPLSFYFNNLLRVPAAKSSAMTFGSAVHYALEYLFKKMLDDAERNFPSVDVMMKDFKYYMRTHEENFTEVEMKRRMEYAEDFLPKYYHTHLPNWNKVVTIERSYRNIVVEGVPLNGKLDKMEFDGNKVNVVDYKTGQFENAKKKFNRPDLEKVEKANAENKEVKFEDEFGGDYWRQAVFYKILVDNDRSKNWEMLSTEFDFVEPDKQSKQYIKEKVIITSDDIRILKDQMHFAYDGIMSKQFDKGCGKEDCDWCNFVNDYYAQNRK
jgi:DNA helicase-2/ATP-dependent DNA helicase PcrA